MLRGWTWINENKVPGDEEIEKVRAVCDAIALRWSNFADRIERAGFDRQAREENGDDGPDFEDEEERAVHEENKRLDRLFEEDQLLTIEKELARFGARMMRPYEHWNEDEQLMEWLERDQ
jgi:hypothetical protein